MSAHARRGLILSGLLVLLALLLPAAAGAIAGRDVKILGGIDAAPGQLPWMAALVDPAAPNAADGIFCGGTVIAPRVVLTAAHCVTGTRADEIQVVTGRVKLSSAGDGQRVAVSQIYQSPTYSKSTSVGDWALLQLAQPVAVTPLTLAAPTDTALQAPGAAVFVSGWGATADGGDVSDALRFVRLHVRSGSTCSNHYGDVPAATTVCAGSQRAGEDSCQGDSGGPLFSGDGTAARLVGIVSYGDGCGKAGVPAVYTRASAYRDPILAEAAVLGGTAPAPAPAPPAQAPTVRFGKITCRYTCSVSLTVTGRAPAGGIVLNVVRKASGGRKKVDRFVFAKQSSSGRWTARTTLPFGKLTLYAIPLTAAQDDLDGNGDVERIEIVPA